MFMWHSFILGASSLNARVAQELDDGGIVFQIETKSGAMIDKCSYIPDDMQEVLIPLGCRYKVTEHSPQSAGMIIQIEEIDLPKKEAFQPAPEPQPKPQAQPAVQGASTTTGNIKVGGGTVHVDNRSTTAGRDVVTHTTSHHHAPVPKARQVLPAARQDPLSPMERDKLLRKPGESDCFDCSLL